MLMDSSSQEQRCPKMEMQERTCLGEHDGT